MVTRFGRLDPSPPRLKIQDGAVIILKNPKIAKPKQWFDRSP